mmetsp:Transcript_6080/g.9498  ORF Transcript_6080/g.9498 Transcript_6080/m.9498 type:complete len:305 (-) Transcript_6080:78-992(-)
MVRVCTAARETCALTSNLKKVGRKKKDKNKSEVRSSQLVLLLQAMMLLLVVTPAAEAFVPAFRKSSGGVFMMSSSGTPSTYKKVFVAGGTKGVGRAIVEKLTERGTQVVALVRSEESKANLEGVDGVTAVLGDAFDQKAVENAMDGCDAAITTLGGTTEDRRVDYEGNNNVIESAGILGIPRIILVTSIGCGSSKEAAPPSVFEVLKEVLAAKEKAENVLIDFYTNVNWTIIRPGGLVTAPMTGEAILTEDNTAIGSIHREDVAALVVAALHSPKTERKVLSAVDPSITSSVAVEGKVIPSFVL